MGKFEDLPTEVRALIYQHLFAGRKLRCNPRSPYHTRSDKSASIGSSKYSQPVPILLINRRCREEALAVIYNQATTDLTYPISRNRFLQPRCYPTSLTSLLAHIEIHLATLVTSQSRFTHTRLQASLARLPNIRTITLLLRSENHHRYHIQNRPTLAILLATPPPIPPFPEPAPDGLLAHAARQIQRGPYQMLDRGAPHQLVRHVLQHWTRSRTATTRRSQGAGTGEHRGYDLRTRLELRYLSPTARPHVCRTANGRATLRADCPLRDRSPQRAVHATYSFAKGELVVEGAAGIEEQPVSVAMRVEVDADGKKLGVGGCSREQPCNAYCQTSGFPAGYKHLVSLL